MERRQFFKAAGLSAVACASGAVMAGCQEGIGSFIEENVHSDPADDPSNYTVADNAKITSFAYDVDVLIIGSGIAGLSAAIEPVKAGLSVLVAEKLGTLGGESYLSYGIVRVSGSDYQVSHEAKTSAQAAWDAHKNDALFSGVKDTDLAKRLFFAAPEWIDILVQEFKAEFASPQEQAALGIPTNFLFPSGGVGTMQGVLASLQEGLKQKGVEFISNSKACSFILDQDKAVAGVRFAAGEDIGYLDVRAKRIIMATGGFASSQTMVQAYAPAQINIGTVTYASNGEGLNMLLAMGAETADMEKEIHMVGDVPQVSSWGIFGPTIAINSNGERFVNEDDAAAAALACVLEEQCFWWTVFDNQICEGFLSSGIAETLSKYSKRVVGPCNTVEELADALNMNAEKIAKTFEGYDAAVAKGNDLAFGRKLFLKKLKAPFYAIKQTPMRCKSFGGIAVNENFQPLCADKAVLSKVYCCGSLIASCEDGLSACGASGFLAGSAALASLSEK